MAACYVAGAATAPEPVMRLLVEVRRVLLVEVRRVLPVEVRRVLLA